MNTVIHLVDSIEYANSNCFQHQLTRALQHQPNIRTVSLDAVASLPYTFDRVACCLKQRTLHKHAEGLSRWLGRVPVICYDQDPWEAFREGSPYKGTYENVMKHLNVEAFAVTTQLWAGFLTHRSIPSTFVSMWVMPEYCDKGPTYEDRPVKLGFIGTLHPYRQALVDELESKHGLLVNVQSGNTLPYPQYLKALQNIQVFIHGEDFPMVVDQGAMNLSDGLWIKDIEAASQGCFSIRNHGAGSGSYFSGFPVASDGLGLLRTYRDVSDVPRILEGIERMDEAERQDLIDRTVHYIRLSDRWQETAATLTMGQGTR